MPMKPQVYADLLSEKLKNNDCNVWLVNTGWTGGRYGVGKVTFMFIFFREFRLVLPEQLLTLFMTVLYKELNTKL